MGIATVVPYWIKPKEGKEQMLDMRLNTKALDALAWAKDKQIVPEDLTEIEIIRIVYDQEIVTWCSEAGCVSFDTYDVEHLD